MNVAMVTFFMNAGMTNAFARTVAVDCQALK
jgi:hypothetical protein